ncbi:MAG: acyl carrier protein [Kiritimatiellae bacterium]|nr:acyl carrier protein [Kiritimatiellia bacterium]
MTRPELEQEIRKIILDAIDDDSLTEADFPADVPLFGDDGVGLDSIDALEIGVRLRRRFGIQFKTSADENKAFFKSIATLADFVASHAADSGITSTTPPEG